MPDLVVKPLGPSTWSGSAALVASPEGQDLGFSHRVRKDGDVEVLHRGRVASTLRGNEAQDFLAQVEAGSESDAQRLMARISGNYKRGNERLASQHPRNRR
jgi:hypothetical protein